MRSWTTTEGAVLVRELALFVVYLNVLLGNAGGGYQVVQGCEEQKECRALSLKETNAFNVILL